VFQAFNLLDHMTCWENVCLPAFFGKQTGSAYTRAATLLQRVGLDEKVDAKPSNMSGGQKQRVAIARALYNQPKLLLCDEPTGNLDTKTGAQILELFYQLNREDGITVIVVTHETRVSAAANRVIRLEDGRLAGDDRTSAEASAAARAQVRELGACSCGEAAGRVTPEAGASSTAAEASTVAPPDALRAVGPAI
jgi:putative ABC transport system ATP-binding protein